MADEDSKNPEGGGDPTIVSLDYDTKYQPRPDLWRHAADNFSKLNSAATGVWQQIGPAPLSETAVNMSRWMGQGALSGEVTGIAIDPRGSSDQAILISTGDGGIWMTTDGATTWVPVTDNLPSLSTGAIALDPANPSILYAGTGNPVEASADTVYDSPRGIGVYKSVDRGATWFVADGGPFASCMAGFAVTKIVVPQTDVVLVGTNHGLFRSVDGGLNFGANAPKFNDGQPLQIDSRTDLAVSDLVIDSRTATTVYACISAKGIYVSTDAGATFPATSNLFNKPGAPSSFTDISLAERNGNIFASVSGPGPSYVGLFLLAGAAAQWLPCPDAKRAEMVDVVTRDQTNYDLTVGIDPQDSSNQRVFIGFQRLWLARSPGGAVNFGPGPCSGLPANPADPSGLRNSQVHADHHAIAFSPSTHASTAPSPRIYVGTDGGIFGSPDGLTWSSLNAQIATALLYGFDMGVGSAANAAFNYAAMQDNSLASSQLGDGHQSWGVFWSGDGLRIAVDPSDPHWAYGFTQDALVRTSDGGTNFLLSSQGSIGIGLPSTSTFTKRIAVDQVGMAASSRTLYISMDKELWKSTDSGANFGSRLKSFSDLITALTVAPTNTNTVWIGLKDGTVHISTDGGVTWDAGSFSEKPGGKGPVAAIAVDSGAANNVVVAYSQFTEINPTYGTRHVFRTSNNGNTWTDISGTDGNGPVGNLPDVPVNSIAIDSSTNPSTIIVGTGCGVARTLDNGASWQSLGIRLPRVRCSAVAFDRTTHVLRVATFGRSCFELQHPTGPFLAGAYQYSFGALQSGLTRTISFPIYNVGDTPFDVTGFSQILGDSEISLNPPFGANVTIAAGGSQNFTLEFSPSSAKSFSATFQMTTNDPGHPNFLVFASGVGVAAGTPRLSPVGNLHFGTVNKDQSRTLLATLSNSGSADLHIQSISGPQGSSPFSLTNLPALPLTLKPGDSVQFSCIYKPTGNDDNADQIVVSSDDPRSPTNIPVTGTGVGFTNWVLVIACVAGGILLAGGAAIAAYQLEKK